MRTGQKRMGVALLAAAVVIVAIIVVATLGHNPPSSQAASSTPSTTPTDTASTSAAPAQAAPAPTAQPAPVIPAPPPVDDANLMVGGPVGGQAAWDKACEPDGSGGLLCMVSQSAVRTGASDKLLRLALGPVGPGGEMRLVLTVPPSVLLTAGATVQVDQQRPFSAPFVVCLQGSGCQAVLSLDQAAYDGLKAAQQVSVRYTIADGRSVRATILLAGMGDAVAQLAPASAAPAK